MDSKVRESVVAGSALVALIGAMVTVVYVFQPWRSCDYEDTSAGCAMLPADATVMSVATVMTIVSVAVLVLVLLVKKRPTVR